MKYTEILVVIFLIFLTGCRGANTMYYWGDYSSTLYNYTKTPSSESRTEHKSELIQIVNDAQRKKKGVPPGIHFELAMLEAEDGNEKRSLAHFEKETKLFPESEKYVALALKELGVQ